MAHICLSCLIDKVASLMMFLFNYFIKGVQTQANEKPNPLPKSEKSVKITDMWIGGVTGAFIIIIVAIVIVCVLMRNIQRNNSKKAAEHAQHATQNVNQDPVSKKLIIVKLLCLTYKYHCLT